MMRSLLGVVIWCGLFLSSVSAEEFTVRVDAFEREINRRGEAISEDSLLRSIEVIARPGERFRAKVCVGKTTHLLTGKLEAVKEGTYRVHFRCAYLVDSGDTLPDENGNRVPRISKEVMQSVVTVTPGDEAEVGGLVTQSGEPINGSELRFVIHLDERDPSAGDGEVN